ncbi:MAG: lipopolysaccharide biosynthesis protein [Janthinobacterium lividum]
MTKSWLPTVAAYLRNPHLLSMAGNLAVSGLGIVSVGLLFRALSVRDIGVWVLFSSTIGLADAFRAGFLTTAFVRARAGASPARATEVAGSAWVIALVITGALALLNLGAGVGAGLVFKAAEHPEATLLLRWFGVVLVASLPNFMAGCVLQAELRFDRLLYLRLLTQGLFVASIAGLMLTHTATLERVVHSYVLATAATAVVMLALGWAGLGSLASRTSACVRELAHFGKYSVGSYLGSSLLRSSDTFIISMLLGPAALAVYNLPGRFSELIELPLRSFLATATPAMAAAFHQHRLAEVARLLRKNAGILTWAFVPLVLGTLLLADVPVYLIGGGKYRGTEAANLLRIGMVMALLYPIDRFVGVTLDIVNQPRLNLIKVFLMLAVNVLADVVALSLFHSIYAVALASIPTILVGFAFGFVQLKKWLPVSLHAIVVTGWDEIRILARRLVGKPTPPLPAKSPTEPFA